MQKIPRITLKAVLRLLTHYFLLVFKHGILLPSVLGGMLFLTWMIAGNPQQDRLSQLQHLDNAFRSAPVGYMMNEICPQPTPKSSPPVLTRDCPVYPKALTQIAAADVLTYKSYWLLLVMVSNLVFILSRATLVICRKAS